MSVSIVRPAVEVGLLLGARCARLGCAGRDLGRGLDHSVLLLDRLDHLTGFGIALQVGVHRVDGPAQRTELLRAHGIEGGVPLAAEVRGGLLLEAAVGRDLLGDQVRQGVVQDLAFVVAQPVVGLAAREEDDRPRPQVDVGHQVRARCVETAVLDAGDRGFDPVEPGEPVRGATSLGSRCGVAPSAVSVASATLDCCVPMVSPRKSAGVASGPARPSGCRRGPGRMPIPSSSLQLPRGASRPGHW